MATKIAGPEKRARRVGKKKAATPVDAPSSAEVLRTEQLVEAMSLALPQRVAIPALLARHPRLLLVGDAGSGKTTLIAYLATRAARGELAAEAGWNREPVPFVLTVRSLKAVPSSREALAAAVGCEAWFLDAVLQQGRAFLLVDGLDEARTEVAAGLLDAVIAHVEAHPENRLLVTTRPAGLGSDTQSSHPKLDSSRLVPMTREEVDQFIDQWCLAAEVSVQKDSGRARAEEDARKASEDLKARVRSSRAVERLAETPLLCSVLCIVHRFMGQRIPERRAALYEVTTNVLLYEWDRAKFPEGSAVGKLDAQEKRILLGHLARSMHEARVAELSADQVIKKIGERLPNLGRPKEDARTIVEEIRDRSGVLVERTPGAFAFSHLTFQEYLTALDVVRTRDYGFLLSNHKDKWWHEVIALAAGIPGADAALIINNLLQLRGETLGIGTILAASCTETSIDLPPSTREIVERRIGELISSENTKNRDQLAILGHIAEPILLKRLTQSSSEDKAKIIRALAIIGHESSVLPISQLLTDPSKTSHLAEQWKFEPKSIAWFAAFTLVYLSMRLDFAQKTLTRNLKSAHPDALNCVLELARLTMLPTYKIAKQVLKDAHIHYPRPRSAARTL